MPSASLAVADPGVTARNQRVRYYGILLLLFLAGAINYVDRQTLSVLKPAVKTALGTDEAGYALLLNIFTFCYAGAYIASGWVVDRIGAHRGLMIFIILWSMATIGCGFATTFMTFAICRALLGLAEPGNQPAGIRALTLWVVPERRGLVMSLVGTGSTLGSIVAAPLIAWLATDFGWHAAFVAPGGLGLLIGAAWWVVYRHPTHSHSTGAQTNVPAPALNWPQLWRHRSLWGIVLARFVSDPVWYFCLFWMPGYFQEECGLTLAQAGKIAWIPFFAASIGGILLATLSDKVGKRINSPMQGRVRILIGAAMFGPIAILVPHVSNLTGTVLLLCGVAVVCMGWLGTLGPLVADTFPAGNVASVWGIAGAFGAFGAILFNHQVGQISSHLGTTNMFLVLGCLHLISAAILRLLVRNVNVGTPLSAEQTSATSQPPR